MNESGKIARFHVVKKIASRVSCKLRGFLARNCFKTALLKTVPCDF